MATIEEALFKLSKSKFRSSFHLTKKEREYALEKGLDIIESHARDFIEKRLALRESNPFGLKWKIACLTVLKKLDNFLIACTFSPCYPTYFLI